MAAPVYCAQAASTGGRPSSPVYLVYSPTATVDDPSCTYVFRSGAAYGDLWSPLLGLSVADAHVIGVAVGACWAVVWTFRAIARFFHQ